MKRLIPILLSLILLLSCAPIGHAASDEAVQAAQSLYELGLFNGTGTNPDGTPNFDLDRVPTRQEAIAMLIRLLGKENEAKAGNWEIPFTDVDSWAEPYVGYAYTNGLTTGTGDTTFGGVDTVTDSQYLTFVLRALGYESSTDFQWDRAWEKSDAIELTDGRYNANTTSFTRGDVAVISNRALTMVLKGQEKTLSEILNIKHSISSLQGVYYKEYDLWGPWQEEYIFEGNSYTKALFHTSTMHNSLGSYSSDYFYCETGTYQINGDRILFSGNVRTYNGSNHGAFSTDEVSRDEPSSFLLNDDYERLNVPKLTPVVQEELETRPYMLDTDLIIAKLDISDSLMAVCDLIIGNATGKTFAVSAGVTVDGTSCFAQGDVADCVIEDGMYYKIPLYINYADKPYDRDKLFKISTDSEAFFTLKYNGEYYFGICDTDGNIHFI